MILSRVLITFAAHGLELTHATPGVGYVPWVQQGRAYAVIDSAATANRVTTDDDGRRIVDVGHNHQVGAIVTPDHGAVIVPELGLTWISSSQDFDADGVVTGNDAALWLAMYEQQSPLCDFNADGQTNADDYQAWKIAVEAARPEYSVECDVNRDGFINSADEELFTDWFIAGDMRADIIPDSFLSGEDWDRFMDFYVNGTNGTGER